MHRSPVLALLQAYVPQTTEEQQIKNHIMTFIQRNEYCFERSLAIGHVTASAWLLSQDGSQALMMHHKKLDKWVQLGGHCDGNPDVLAVAVKEAQEESGITAIAPVSQAIFDLAIFLVPENAHAPAHAHYDICFLLQVTGDEEVAKNSESKELRWISKKAKKLPTDEPSVMHLFKKWVQK